MKSVLTACFSVLLAAAAPGAAFAQRGADGIIGTDIVARSAPDGYTLLMASAAFTMNPAVRKMIPVDMAKWAKVAKEAGMKPE